VEDLIFCRDDAERGRLLDMSRRLRAVEARGSLLFLAAAAAGVPTFGFVALLPALPGLALFWLIQSRVARYRRPELALLGCVLLVQSGVAISIVIAHGPRIYLLPLMIIPVLLASVVFPVRVAVLVVGLSAQLMLAVGLGFNLATVRAQPFALLYPLGIMVCGSGIAMVVAGLELATRGAAIVDPLTGLPNRIALRARVSELEHQASLIRRPVALIVGDPDRFKAINDSRGHAVGDAVLREVGARIRAALPAGAGAYRLGGEEFVLLLADADVQQAAALAESVRRRIGARAIEGLHVGISFGVAASSAEDPFRFSRLFGHADRALYEAKRAGGDRVRLWPLAEALAENGAEQEGGIEVAPTGAARGSERHRAAEAMRALARQFERRRADGEADAPGSEQGQSGSEGDWERYTAAEHAATGSWLVQDEVQRRQLLELNRHLREKAKPVFLIGFTLGALSAPIYGWQILILPPLMTAVYIAVEHRLESMRRPELALGLAWLGLQAAFMGSGLIANHQMIAAASLLFLLLIGSSAVFPPRGVAIGAAFTALIMVIVAAVEVPHLLLTAPAIIIFYIAIVVTIAMVGIAVGRATIAYRGLGIVDQLTGLFNRSALLVRAAELEHRPGSAGAAVIVLDVDRFKAINDRHGHAAGDAVLRELGYRVRKNLRAFESAYRIGGEEFVILLERLEDDHAEAVAERLRATVAQAPLAGVPTTVSLGVAVAERERFRYERLFANADDALYAAKRAGGNCVYSARSGAQIVRVGVAAQGRGAPAGDGLQGEPIARLESIPETVLQPGSPAPSGP
jgi:diguanylate cyclase (GGDEF)-like protein